MTEARMGFSDFISTTLITALRALLEAQRPRAKQIEQLRAAYRSGDLVLVLGAGASKGVGLPDWDTLLRTLLIEVFDTDRDAGGPQSLAMAQMFSELFSPGPLVAARFFRRHFREQKSKSPDALPFESVIRNALYEKLPASAATSSPLFQEIRQFCVAAGKSPVLDSIITYNYDDVLERYLDNIGIEIPYDPIYEVGMRPASDRLPIYHVHGYLPGTGDLPTSPRIVLSEDVYHEQYTDIYSWSNIVQINKFTEKTCLFVGVSLSDPNLRRLLDISMRQKGQAGGFHYLVRKRHDVVEIEARIRARSQAGLPAAAPASGPAATGSPTDSPPPGSPPVTASGAARTLVQFATKFDEADALSFAIQTVWIDDFDEIPDMLKEIRGARDHVGRRPRA
jgi:hypothetical protein